MLGVARANHARPVERLFAEHRHRVIHIDQHGRLEKRAGTLGNVPEDDARTLGDRAFDLLDEVVAQVGSASGPSVAVFRSPIV